MLKAREIERGKRGDLWSRLGKSFFPSSCVPDLFRSFSFLHMDPHGPEPGEEVS